MVTLYRENFVQSGQKRWVVEGGHRDFKVLVPNPQSAVLALSARICLFQASSFHSILTTSQSLVTMQASVLILAGTEMQMRILAASASFFLTEIDTVWSLAGWR